MKFIDLSAQYRVLKEEIDEAIRAVLARTDFILGEEVNSLEKELSDYVGSKFCVTCGNGTDAITLALMAIDVKPGDAVFVPSFTFIGTAEPISLLGATPVFTDVDSRSFNISAKSLELEIEDVLKRNVLRPKAIIAVDLFGVPADYNELRRLSDKFNITLIADAAQSFGASYYNKRVGTLADITTTSFFPSKPLGCYGDGGALFTESEELAEIIASCRSHGKGTHKYDHVRLGINSRLDTIQAAILRVKLNYLDKEIQRRNAIADVYRKVCSEEVQDSHYEYISAFAQYSLALKKRDREYVVSLLREDGIPYSVYYPNTLPSSKVYSRSHKKYFPVAESLAQSIISLPVHPYMADEEVSAVSAVLSKIYN